MRKRWHALTLLLAALSLFSGCASSGGGGAESFVTVTVGDDGRSARLAARPATLAARVGAYLCGVSSGEAQAAIPTEVVRIRFTVEASDLPPRIEEVFVGGQETVVHTLVVPNGAGRRFVVEALDGAGTVLFAGSASADLSGGAVSLRIPMMYLDTFGWLYHSTPNDSGVAVEPVPDGGFLLAGNVGGSVSDIQVRRLRYDGRVVWERVLDGGNDEYAAALLATPDGGCYVLGWVYGGFTGSDLLLAKLDPSGAIEWKYTYDRFHVSGSFDIANTMAFLPDGNIGIVGSSYDLINFNTDVLVLRVTPLGGVLEGRLLDAGENEQGNDLAFWPDGTLAVTGNRSTAVGQEVFTARRDPAGAWSAAGGFSSPNFPKIRSILPDRDGGFILAGTATRVTSDIQIVRFDAAGNLKWGKYLTGAGSDTLHAVSRDLSAGFVVAGESTSFGDGTQDALLAYLDWGGNVGWQYVFGGDTWESFTALRRMANGRWVVTGSSDDPSIPNRDMAVLSLTPDGTGWPGLARPATLSTEAAADLTPVALGWTDTDAGITTSIAALTSTPATSTPTDIRTLAP